MIPYAFTHGVNVPGACDIARDQRRRAAAYAKQNVTVEQTQRHIAMMCETVPLNQQLCDMVDISHAMTMGEIAVMLHVNMGNNTAESSGSSTEGVNVNVSHVPSEASPARPLSVEPEREPEPAPNPTHAVLSPPPSVAPWTASPPPSPRKTKRIRAHAPAPVPPSPPPLQKGLRRSARIRQPDHK